jgi:hypothetical protein
MRRIRNPRYAPEFLERKLSPSNVVPASVAPAAYSTVLDPAPVVDEDPTGDVADSSTLDSSDPTSPFPTDPTPSDPGTPDDGNGDPPTAPLPVPTPGPAIY